MNAQAKDLPSSRERSVRDSGQLFSDLNQWMLKVLLAPEIPDGLLSAPRGQYRNASQLARAANVSVMSAFRFVQQLQREGYLHESAPYLSLVRREDLLGRWQALSVRSIREVPMRFVLPGDVQAQLRKLLSSGRACLALFAAADALKLGSFTAYHGTCMSSELSLRTWQLGGICERVRLANLRMSFFGRLRRHSRCFAVWSVLEVRRPPTFCRSGSTWRHILREDASRPT
jgi:hypothetical protein